MKIKLNGINLDKNDNGLEEKISNLDNVKSIKINRSNNIMDIDLKNNNEDTLEKVFKIIREKNKDVVITSVDEEEENEMFELIKIAISLMMFIAIFFLKKYILAYRIILIITYFVIGYKVLFNAIKNIFKGSIFDENFLMAVATIGAIFIGEYSEAVAVMLFYSIGEFLQDKAVDKSKKSISNLINIKSEYANVKIDNKVEKVMPEKVKVDDILVVKPGERIPLDGIIVSGSSVIDNSALTGESLPIDVNKGDQLLSGSINLTSLLEIKVIKTYENSTASRIIDLIENSSNRKAETENFITKFSKIYTPIVVLIALLIAIIPPIITNISFYDSIYKALVCLVISCPCALVISIPLSYFAGIGCASKNGILIKGSNYLDILNKIDTIAFDKTGTLTYGTFSVQNIASLSDYSDTKMLEYCAYAESMSNHPIALSILKKYGKKIDNSRISNYEEMPGKGIRVKVDNKDVVIGNYNFVKENKIKEVDEIGTILYVIIDNDYKGYIVISDEIREESKELINYLSDKKINTVMLTGDNDKTAKKIASYLKVNSYESSLLPSDKVKFIEKYEKNCKKGEFVCFIGDGINDAPVLASADLGIAMGGIGSDSAIEAAGIVLMNDNISKISTAINISKKTKRIVYENITLALVVKIIALLLGIIGVAAIWQAVIADVGITVIAVLNSMRCLYLKKN